LVPLSTPNRPGGGRTWWAHFEFTRINIEPTILPKKFEDLRRLGAFHSVGPEVRTDPVEEGRSVATTALRRT
jgi:hypothetical protein